MPNAKNGSEDAGGRVKRGTREREEREGRRVAVCAARKAAASSRKQWRVKSESLVRSMGSTRPKRCMEGQGKQAVWLAAKGGEGQGERVLYKLNTCKSKVSAGFFLRWRRWNAQVNCMWIEWAANRSISICSGTTGSMNCNRSGACVCCETELSSALRLKALQKVVRLS